MTTPTPYRWLVIDEDGDLQGTNNEVLAQRLSRDHDTASVYDTQRGVWLHSTTEGIDEVDEATWFPEDEDGDDDEDDEE